MPIEKLETDRKNYELAEKELFSFEKKFFSIEQSRLYKTVKF